MDVPTDGRLYTATCVVSFVAAVPLNMVSIQWLTKDGHLLSTVNDRVEVPPVRQISNDTFARDVIVNPLKVEDSGTYVCSAGVLSNYTTGQFVNESVGIGVLRK